MISLINSTIYYYKKTHLYRNNFIGTAIAGSIKKFSYLTTHTAKTQVSLIPRMPVYLFHKRFFPGPGITPFLSPSSAQRLMALFLKHHNIHPSVKHCLFNNINFTEGLQKLRHSSPSRQEFFKSLRVTSSLPVTSLNETYFKTLFSSPKDNTLLLPSYPKKDTLSGLLNLTPKEKSLLKDDTVILGQELKEFLVTILAKVLFHINKNIYPSLEDYLTNGIKATFGSINLEHFSNQIKQDYFPRILSFIQHYVVNIFGHKSFSIDILEKICGPYVSVESYKDSAIKILTFIELMHVKYLQVLMPFIKMPLKYHLVDSEHTHKVSAGFNKIHSKEKTGQENADTMFEKLDPSSDTEDKFYYDIKTYVTLGVKNCRFALIHPYSYKQIKDYINNISTSIKSFMIDNNLLEDKYLKDLYESIILIQKNTDKNKLNSVIKSYLQIITLLAETTMVNKYPKLRIGLAIPASKDTLFNKFNEELFQLNKEKLKKSIKNIEEFFPQNRTINHETHAIQIEEMIKTLFPENMQKQILDTIDEWTNKAITL